MQERKLATVRRISALTSIENADRIELATVDGWKVIVNKGLYQVNDLVCYVEIDSWVPHILAPFLTEVNKQPKVYNSTEGQRLRTKKIRGVISQGLILPLSVLNHVESELMEGLDVTVPLKIQLWEPPISPQLAGQVRGSFPSLIPKTSAERIQNVRNLDELMDHTWEQTEKIHGSSCTFYLDDNDEFHVCSRNLDLKFDENNAYWKMAIQYDIEAKMKANDLYGFAIQGELIGEGVNGNQYGVKELDFLVFNIYDVSRGDYLNAEERNGMITRLNLKHVPVLSYRFEFSQENTVQSLLEQADGQSLLNGSQREGFVLKSQQDPSIILKVISNAWLLKNE